MLLRLLWCIALSSGFSAVAVVAWAQSAAESWPAKPVSMVVPYSPGGSSELEARLYANKLTEIMGKPFLLDFKPGVGTVLGTNFAAKAPPDGHTIIAVTATYGGLPAAYPDLPFDPLNDLAPVAQMTSRSTVVVVSARLPVKSLQELIAYGKSAPGKINQATAGQGSGTHIRAEWLYKLAGVQVTYVHYKGNSQSTMLDLVAGRTDAILMLPALAQPLAKAGKVRIIATAGDQRSSNLPDVPTVAEQGYPEFSYTAWGGILAPGRTPPAIIARLNTELLKVARSPDIIQKLGEDGNTMVGSTPEQFRKLIASDIAVTRRMVKETGITPGN